MPPQDAAVPTEYPTRLGRTARRELAVHGFTRYDQLTSVTARDLQAIHGVGPKAIRILTDELEIRGLAFQVDWVAAATSAREPFATLGRPSESHRHDQERRQPVSGDQDASEIGEATPGKSPTDFVAGVIDDRSSFDAALKALTEAGFEEAALEVRYGQAGIDAFTSRPRHWFSDILSDASDYEDRFVQDLREGHYAIRVRIGSPQDAQRTLARDTLRQHGAHHIVSAGRWSFETDPDYPPAR